MFKHKAIPKIIRQQVYEKCNHHCAYCGCDLEYKDMQVDHINSVYRNGFFNEIADINNIENLLPACRQCNFYKQEMTIDEFRSRIENTLMQNLRKLFIYKLAIKYGLVVENINSVKFYFEEESKK